MKKIVLKILGIITIIMFLLQVPVTMAASTTDLKNQQKANEKKIEEQEQKKEEVTAEKNKTVEEVEDITNQITNYENQISELNSKISDLNTKIEESERKITEAQEKYDEQKKLLDTRLVVAYEQGETSYLDVLLSSENIVDFISNYFYISELATSDTELMNNLQKEKEEIEQAKTDLENSKKELDTSKAEKQSITTQLEQTKSEKNQKVTELTQDEQQIQAQIDELAEANKSLDAQILKVQKQIQAQIEANKNKGNSSSGGTSTGGGPVSNSGFIYPVPSGYTRITTGINYSSGQYHGAVDFGCAGINGQPVYAVADGIVVTAQSLTSSYGTHVIIAHYNGLYTLYAHGQSGSLRVSAGQKVKQGQQIMNVGSTGNSTGPHLHFEVRTSPGTYSCRKNPMNYLP